MDISLRDVVSSLAASHASVLVGPRCSQHDAEVLDLVRQTLPGANVNQTVTIPAFFHNETNDVPLVLACRWCPAVVECLLDNGAEVPSGQWNGFLAWSWANVVFAPPKHAPHATIAASGTSEDHAEQLAARLAQTLGLLHAHGYDFAEQYDEKKRQSLSFFHSLLWLAGDRHQSHLLFDHARAQGLPVSADVLDDIPYVAATHPMFAQSVQKYVLEKETAHLGVSRRPKTM